MAPLHVGVAANGLAIGHLRGFQVDLGVVAVLHLRDRDFDVLLARAGDQKLLRLRIAEEAQHGVFFHQLGQVHAQLVFVRPRLRLNREGDGRLGQLDHRILYRRSLVAQRIARQACL